MLENAGLTGVPGHQVYGSWPSSSATRSSSMFDEGDVVAGGGEDLGDLGAEPARAGDEGLHVPSSLSRKAAQAAERGGGDGEGDHVPCARRVLWAGTSDRPPRVTSTTRISPSTSNSASRRPLR